MSALPLGAARKRRGIFEGKEWKPHLHRLGFTQAEWDEYFRFTIEENVSVQYVAITLAWAAGFRSSRDLVASVRSES